MKSLLAFALLFLGGSQPAQPDFIEHVGVVWACSGGATTFTVPQVEGEIAYIKVLFEGWSQCGARMFVPPFGYVIGPHTLEPIRIVQRHKITSGTTLKRFQGTTFVHFTAWRSGAGNSSICAGARIHLRFFMKKGPA